MKDDHLFIIVTKSTRRKKADDINDPDVERVFCAKHDLVSYEVKEQEAEEAHKLI